MNYGSTQAIQQAESAREPEAQREHASLMNELEQASRVLAELAERLVPVRAERPASTTKPPEISAALLTDIGKRFRAAHSEVACIRRRIGELISEIEV